MSPSDSKGGLSDEQACKEVIMTYSTPLFRFGEGDRSAAFGRSDAGILS
jgi:hypothetical protein